MSLAQQEQAEQSQGGCRAPSEYGQEFVSRWSGSQPQIAAGLGRAFAGGQLSERETAVALEVFKSLLRSTEIEVRRTLAEHIRCSPLLPRSMAMKLAEDVETVAAPILQFSPVLTDADLVAIVTGGNPAKQRAIAGRDRLSEVVSGALVDTGDKSVVEILLANDGAAISEQSYHNLLDIFAGDRTIQELLAERPVLPFAVTERLVCLVSKALQVRIIERHSLPPQMVEQLFRHGQERALLQSLAALKCSKEIDAAVQRLQRSGALTATLLLRALSAGLLEFFGSGMAALAGVPAARAQNALRKAGTPALVSLYDRAKLPVHLQPAFQIVLEAVLERRRAGHTGAEPDLEQRIVVNLVRAFRQISPDNLDSVIYQLGRLSADNAEGLRL